jgi:hypothetical protein
MSDKEKLALLIRMYTRYSLQERGVWVDPTKTPNAWRYNQPKLEGSHD